ncbi:MAG TPA: TetR family transcriptional regulator [Solirubrobacteraceae bacterium]|nr:TetR family transcriptional regulator [Solirubrobacteraceae bacterium]
MTSPSTSASLTEPSAGADAPLAGTAALSKEELPSTSVTGARERILRATLQLIASGGVAAVTNRRVATAAGVSLGSLTYHFASQAQLLHESLLLYVEEETARREQIARDLATQDPNVEQVAEAVERIIATASDIPQQIAEMELHLHAARDPELRDASQRCFEAHEQIATAALTALGIPDGERHAPTVVALMTGLAIRRLAAGGHNARGTSEALLALVRGLGSQPTGA